MITLTNRSSEPVEGVWDGKVTVIPPGESQHPLAAAQAYQRQHPVMGTYDPFTGACEFLLVSDAFGDVDFTPVEQTDAQETYVRAEGEIEYARVKRFPITDRATPQKADVMAYAD